LVKKSPATIYEEQNTQSRFTRRVDEDWESAARYNWAWRGRTIPPSSKNPEG
jgi:hypothetical protein